MRSNGIDKIINPFIDLVSPIHILILIVDNVRYIYLMSDDRATIIRIVNTKNIFKCWIEIWADK
jgi:hypothetical protein